MVAPTIRIAGYVHFCIKLRYGSCADGREGRPLPYGYPWLYSVLSVITLSIKFRYSFFFTDSLLFAYQAKDSFKPSFMSVVFGSMFFFD